MIDPDIDIRLAAFDRLHFLKRVHGGAIPWSALKEGFVARGGRMLFASAAEGIFRPVGMAGLLSVKTVVPKPKGRIWYHDQGASEPASAGGLLPYAFTGDDPRSTRNQWLREAMERQLPIIYFFGVAPSVYEPIFPAFVVEWNPDRLSCELSFTELDDEAADGLREASSPLERRYAATTVQQRLHQAIFRERVLAAYGGKCALTGLPEPRLIDAAHIVSDRHETLGQPDVRNGIAMSKIHHAAYDAGLIGIDPDLCIHVSEKLLAMEDGPVLEQGLKALDGTKMRLPSDPWAAPDRVRLAHRFELYAAA